MISVINVDDKRHVRFERHQKCFMRQIALNCNERTSVTVDEPRQATRSRSHGSQLMRRFKKGIQTEKFGETVEGF
jgi:hypothetical protein